MRLIEYDWHLSEIMARQGIRNSTDLVPLLAERGINLSRTQVYRLSHQKPERVSLVVVGALCDIFSCDIGDLLTFTVAAKPIARTGTTASRGSKSGSTLAPRRVKITDDE
ncbi:helix-turn-helix domain-containing protein [Dietzia timorensis]|uniref:HTH cro/C1-type domain-containing protein n=1 Tax=Dietzia timorensis TaxID=499555 RepID=A0A173LJB5_9ACTN|nr:helix-turn-helix transcriptional regulator [Dietzia timorensis]ANI92375.1 Hypothetical protein BJL86_1598 [Dietzia timorensis]